VSRPFLSSRFDHPNNILWEVQIANVLCSFATCRQPEDCNIAKVHFHTFACIFITRMHIFSVALSRL
jgi:hypothetical protein